MFFPSIHRLDEDTVTQLWRDPALSSWDVGGLGGCRDLKVTMEQLAEDGGASSFLFFFVVINR